MNKRLTFHLIGNVLRMAGALMALPVLVSLIEHSGDTMPLLLSMLIAMAAGTALALIQPRRDTLRPREGFAVVAFSWILVSVLVRERRCIIPFGGDHIEAGDTVILVAMSGSVVNLEDAFEEKDN